MQDRVPYEYAVIRLVPKVELEEFLNIGVILYSKQHKYLGIKYNVDITRIQAFSREVDTALVATYLEAWEAICKGEPNGGAIGKLEIGSRFRWLAASRSTIIQSSKTHPGICSDPQQVLVDLYTRYLSRS